MRRCPRRLLALVGTAVLLLGGGARAQPRFAHLTVDDGLAHNGVTAALQDRLGFLWVGTAGGLSRYDGYAFDVFQYDPTDPASLSDNRVGALMEGRDGTLWVGTAAGLDRLRPQAGAFDRLGRDPRAGLGRVDALYEDARGRVWIGHGGLREGGLRRYDPATRRVEAVPLPGAAAAPVRAFAETPDGALWVGTARGLFRYDPAADAFTAYRHDPANPATLAGDDVRTLAVDRAGALWVGLWGRGLDRLDPATGAVAHHRAGPEDTNLASDFVSALSVTAEGVLWVGTASPDGRAPSLHRYDLKLFTRFSHDPTHPASMAAGDVRMILEDHARVLWVGTAAGGLARFDQASRPIPHFAADPADPAGLPDPFVTAFAEVEKGALWVGTAHGLLRLDRFQGTFERLSRGPGALSGLRVTALARAPDGALWVGTDRGLDRLDPATGGVRSYRAAGFGAPVRALAVDADGALWVGTDRGLDRLDAAGAAHHVGAGAGGLADDRVTALLPDPAAPGVLWVGTERGGLDRLDTATGRVTHHRHRPADPTSLGHPHVTALCARPGEPGVLWVGTAAGGLTRLEVVTGRATRYTRKTSGLPGNAVAGVLHDDEGHLWVATNGGLARVTPGGTPGTGSAAGRLDVRVYDVDRGVQSRQFNTGAAYRTPRGELAFGGINGFNLFAPGDFHDSPFPPRVVVTDVLVDGASRLQAAGSVLMDSALGLPHDRNDLTFRFVGLHYGRPAQNRYRVRLDGHETGWRDVGTQRMASYANLAPGRYTFRVLAANGDGAWAPEAQAAALGVVIWPPFWATWWFRLGAAVAAVGLVVTAYRWRVSQIARQNRALEALVAERTEALRAQARRLEEQHAALEAKNDELEKALDKLHHTQGQLVHAEKLASLGRLTAGVAHEIKNPLNFVNNFALLSEDLAAELRAALEAAAHRPVAEAMEDLGPLLDDLTLNAGKIAEHGRRADGIVRAMLLHARGTAGEREPADLHALLNESLGLAVHGVKALGGDGAGAPAVVTERDYDPAVGAVVMNRQAVGRVVLNLLDNALYAVRERAAREGAPAGPAPAGGTSPAGYVPRVVLRTRLEAAADAPAARVRIEVEDNGVGVPEAVRVRLFEPFFTTKPAGVGTGLGLSLAHDIVRGHGGALAVRSREGEGTVFTVTLPAGPVTPEGAD